MAAHKNVSTQTVNHFITIADGKLTITGEQKVLATEETLILMEILLIWQYGLDAVILDDLEG